MKRRMVLASMALLVFGFSFLMASAQILAGPVTGKITTNGEPLSNAKVVLTNPETSRRYETKTNKAGECSWVGVSYGTYKVQIIDSKGEVLYTNDRGLSVRGDVNGFVADIAHPEASGGKAGGSLDSESGNNKKMSKEERAKKQEEENARVARLNAFITQAQSAMQAQNWAEAETALKQLIAADPETTRWEFYKTLGDVQGHLGHQQDAIANYEKGVEIAQRFASAKLPVDPKIPTTDLARAKAGIGQMLTSEGNAYFGMNNRDKAAELYGRAAEMSPNPAVAYYNLCATQFNRGEMAAAVAACEKSIAADPTQANPYYIKGTVLYKSGKPENGKYVVPPGTVEALSKYLELAPNGDHTSEVRVMLQVSGKPAASNQ